MLFQLIRRTGTYLALPPVVQALSTLLSSNPTVFKPCLPKVVESCVAYLASRDKDSDKQKVRDQGLGSAVPLLKCVLTCVGWCRYKLQFWL